MNLTILGSGGAMPNAKRSAPSYLLKIKDDLILLDAGPGALRQFTRIKEDYFNLSHILISHTHADHMTDLIAIIQSMVVRTINWAGGDVRKKPLIIVGPPGFKKIFYNFKKIMSPEEVPFEIKVFEMGERGKKDFGSWKLESTITQHVKYWDALSYKITAQNKIFVYSGDTRFCQEIIEFCKGAGILLLDCVAPTSEASPQTHLNPQLASEIAAISGAKTLILTHIYDILTSQEEIKEKAKEKFNGKIYIAKDFQKIKL